MREQGSKGAREQGSKGDRRTLFPLVTFKPLVTRHWSLVTLGTLKKLVTRHSSLVTLLSLAGLMQSCAGYPRLLNFPFDVAGRGLNSLAAEVNPQVAGRYIVFISDRRQSQDIYLYDAVDRRLVDLPGINALDVIASHPGVSEDGTRVVFAGSREGRVDIYLYNVPTRQLRNLTENLRAEVRNPSISADGSTIAFESGAQGQWNIMLVNSTGKPVNLPDALQ
jgi:dipeptidyl aminopeptidase/acylaminoacyl peptidase